MTIKPFSSHPDHHINDIFESALGRSIYAWQNGTHPAREDVLELTADGFDISDLQDRHFKAKDLEVSVNLIDVSF